MKWSKSFINTIRETPADAEIDSHKLLIRAGMIKKLGPGIHVYGTLMMRAMNKLQGIIREEHARIGSQEIVMPMVHPQELWEESGRWQKAQGELLKFKNRNGHGFVLGPTHEEVVTDYVRNGVKSYRDLPVSLFQIQTKYRDEIRPRFGLMRAREFLMKDAYTFDVDSKAALKSYDDFYGCYKAIFSRLGLRYVIVKADAGNIGGSKTHEFQVLADAGEDHLMVCNKCSFAANIEVAQVKDTHKKPGAVSDKMEEFATPKLRTIDDLSKALKIPHENLVKTLFFSGTDTPSDKDFKPICVLLRGNDELNPIKLKNLLGLSNPPLMLKDSEVQQVTGAMPGSCGPVGLKIPIYMDFGVQNLGSYVVGANKDDFHLKNVVKDRDFKVTQLADLRLARAGDSCTECDNGKYESHRGIEVGHVFFLGTKYSEAMHAEYLDEKGQKTPIEMGCYGIGVTRTIQAAIEQSHDADGIIWPMPLAPFHVHICLLDPKDAECAEVASKIYSGLGERGIEVFMDDRDERPGVKFKDADLLGMPVRLVIGSKGVKAGNIELVIRKTKEKKELSLNNAVDAIESVIVGEGDKVGFSFKKSNYSSARH
jgi:prolyl-tRNA synthetase